MGTEQGRDTRLYVNIAETFTKIGGETNHSYSADSPAIDTSDKDGGSGSFGQRTIKIGVSGNTKIPDAGLEALYAASKANPPHVEVQIKYTDGSIRFQGLVAVGSFKVDRPIGVSTWSAELTNAANPTVDNAVAYD